MSGHTLAVNCIELIDGDRLASGSNDYSIRIWNLTSYSLIYTFSSAHSSQWILALKRIPGGLLASGSVGSSQNLKVILAK